MRAGERVTATPIADAIRRIEDRIGDEAYWSQGRAWRPGGRACLAAAAGEVVPLDADAPTFALLRSVLAAYAGNPSLSAFNDDSATTHADVMLFLATALDVAEAEGL